MIFHSKRSTQCKENFTLYKETQQLYILMKKLPFLCGNICFQYIEDKFIKNKLESSLHI